MGLIEAGRVIRSIRMGALGMMPVILIIVGFWFFLSLEKREILFVYFTVVLFDGACQIIGQLLGKTPLMPSISPNKTVEGLIGGVIVCLVTAVLVKTSFQYGWLPFMLYTGMILVSAFTGDLLASALKRAAGISSFGKVLPGQGGILDRFDSFIMAGAVFYLGDLIVKL
jgi:phosphatidate cytidylyltransferase